MSKYQRNFETNQELLKSMNQTCLSFLRADCTCTLFRAETLLLNEAATVSSPRQRPGTPSGLRLTDRPVPQLRKIQIQDTKSKK